MPTVADTNEYTAEDLFRMRDEDQYELDDGHLVERGSGFLAGIIGGNILLQIAKHCKSDELGYISTGGYQCFPENAKVVRKPDVSFVRYGRFPNEQIPSGYAQLAPDLAVEVTAPNDLYEEVARKIDDYLRAGVRLIWIVSPESKTVLVYHSDGLVQRLGESDELQGEDVLPGFRCLVGDLFPKPPDCQ